VIKEQMKCLYLADLRKAGVPEKQVVVGPRSLAATSTRWAWLGPSAETRLSFSKLKATTEIKIAGDRH
jgi:hypothetical protein